MEGVPMWPAERMHSPIGFRWEKDMLAQVSFSEEMWPATSSVHGSTPRTPAKPITPIGACVQGMKLWSWGRSESRSRKSDCTYR
jgi:hypothetical protein